MANEISRGDISLQRNRDYKETTFQAVTVGASAVAGAVAIVATGFFPIPLVLSSSSVVFTLTGCSLASVVGWLGIKTIGQNEVGVEAELKYLAEPVETEPVETEPEGAVVNLIPSEIPLQELNQPIQETPKKQNAYSIIESRMSEGQKKSLATIREHLGGNNELRRAVLYNTDNESDESEIDEDDSLIEQQQEQEQERKKLREVPLIGPNYADMLTIAIEEASLKKTIDKPSVNLALFSRNFTNPPVTQDKDPAKIKSLRFSLPVFQHSENSTGYDSDDSVWDV